MKITKIIIFKIDLPMKEGSYSWAKQSFSSFDSTIVIIETDVGITGVGETCPLYYSQSGFLAGRNKSIFCRTT